MKAERSRIKKTMYRIGKKIEKYGGYYGNLC
jgi:hypothetical protein